MALGERGLNDIGLGNGKIDLGFFFTLKPLQPVTGNDVSDQFLEVLQFTYSKKC